MQTFLPYPGFAESARVLDYRRLGKQRVEVLQLLKALLADGGWSNHPAANMWKHRENSLVSYGIAICNEWISRGYKDTCLDKISAFWDEYAESSLPDWLGNPDFHAAHRSNLLRKDPVHYGQFGWTEPNDLPYIWPTV
jgi:hypothetical protein